jgi:hypothetical protein
VYITNTLANPADIDLLDPSNPGKVTPLGVPAINSPYGVAVYTTNTGAVEVFIANSGDSEIDQFDPSTGNFTTLVGTSAGVTSPIDVAVDSSGNVFFLQNSNHELYEISNKTPVAIANLSVPKIIPGDDSVTNPLSMAIDGSGNIYVADPGDNTIKEWVKSTNSVKVLISQADGGFNSPSGVAVDNSGDVFIADTGNNAVEEWSGPSGPIKTLVSDLNSPDGVAVDSIGNVYIADFGDGSIEEFLAPPKITTQPQNTSATLGQTGPLTLPVTAVGAAPLTYQWQVSTDSGATFKPLSDGTGVTGSTTPTLKLTGFTSTASAEYQVAVTDSNGQTTTSNAATVGVNPPPLIATQPVNESATTGQTGPELFSVAAASGTVPYSYQWEVSANGGKTFTNVSGSGISGATTATLTINGSALPASGTEYEVVVTDANGVKVSSKAATLTVNAGPTIATQPADASATTGQTTSKTFSVVAANGTGPYTYQWQNSPNGVSFSNLSDGFGISGSTTATLTIASSALTSAGSQFKVIVKDANGVSVTSNAATLTFVMPPSITSQLQSATTANQNQTAPVSFTVTASGGATPLSYQWQISSDTGVSFSNVSNGNGVSGATSATLTLSSFLTAGTFEYRAIVSDVNGVTATSSAGPLVVHPAPVINTQPTNEIATVSQSASESFTIAASGGTGTLSVQWQVSTNNGVSFSNLNDGSGVSGSTSDTLTVSGFTTAGPVEYRAVVTDSIGAAGTSNAATLTINAPPAFATQPANKFATIGQTSPETFTVVATKGTSPYTYQWLVSTNGTTFSNLSNGSGISGATSATLSIASSALSTSGPEYKVVITDANGVSVTSNVATLTFVSPPSITTQPQNAVATVGQSASDSFTVAASGGASPLSVQWQISTNNGGSFSNLSDGNGVSGAASTTLTVSSFATAGSVEYRAVVSDVNGVTATSNAAVVTVNAAPVITAQPQDAVITAGQSIPASFTVGASGGTGALSVQWQISTDHGATFTNLSDGNGVTGSTTTTLAVSGFTSPGSDEYRAIVSDVNGATVTSNAAMLTVNSAFSVVAQDNATANVGQLAPVSFTIGVNGGTAPFSEQWQISTDNGATFTNLSDGSVVTGSAGPVLTVGSFAAVGTVEYQAIVTDANGVSATSNPVTLTINPAIVDPNQSWLTQVYADLLHRPLDSSGLATWTNLLSQGDSRTQVVQLIETSLEYRTDIVEALYAQLLHRPADPSGLDTFTTFLGDGGTDVQVEAAILGSQEYFQLHGGTNDGFLAAIYQDVFNRSVDASGAQSWGLALAGGMTRDAVAQAILTSLEADSDAVQSLYSAFLHRPADPSGLNSFTTALQQGVPGEAVIASIVGSQEYFSLAQAQ